MWDRKVRFGVSLVISIGTLILLLAALQQVRVETGAARVLSTDVGGTLNGDETWTADRSPYVLTETVIVPAGITLTIEPGVEVRGKNEIELRVHGHLAAVGTPTQPITFTEDRRNYKWAGLVFDGGTGDLRHSTVIYGGDETSLGTHGNVAVHNVLDGQVRIQNSRVFSESYYRLDRNDIDYGLYVSDGRVSVSNTRFKGNGNRAIDYSLYAVGSNTVLTLTGNTFESGPGYAVCIEPALMHELKMSGNTFGGAGLNRRTLIAGGSLMGEAHLSAESGLDGYVLDSLLTVMSGAVLNLEQGVTMIGVKNKGEVLVQTGGHLQAVGTVTQPITFTSDTSAGDDKWIGLTFDGGTGELEQVTVQYGGAVSNAVGVHSNIAVRNVLVGQVRIHDSRVLSESFSPIGGVGTDFGLYVGNSRVRVSNTLFKGNGNDADDFTLFVGGNDAVLTLTGSMFESGSGFAVRLDPNSLYQTQMTNNTFGGVGRNRQILLSTGDVLGSAQFPAQTGLESYVLGGMVTVPYGITFTVAPGVKIMGQEKQGEIVVQPGGHLQAVGSPEQPIIFTSDTDDGSHHWNGLAFDGGTGELVEVTVQYGSGASNVIGVHSNIAVRNVLEGQVQIQNSQVLSSSFNPYLGDDVDYGLYVVDSHVLVEDTLFSGNGDARDVSDHALYAAGAHTVLAMTESMVRQNNVNGVTVTGGKALLNELAIVDNGQSGILVTAAPFLAPVFTLTGGIIQVNQAHGVVLDGGRVLLRQVAITDSGGNGIVVAGNSVLTLTKAIVEQNQASGILVTGGDILLSCTRIADNDEHGVRVTSNPISVTVIGSEIDGNAGYGLINTSVMTVPVDARHNWWGDAGGPSGNDIFISGVGGVIAEPYLGVPACIVDLAVAKSGKPDPAYTGVPLTYTVVVTNVGISPVDVVTVTDYLPTGVQFIPDRSPDCEFGDGGNVVTCFLERLASGATEDVLIVVNPSAAAVGSIVNMAVVTTSDRDLWMIGNTAVYTTMVEPQADLVLAKRDSGDPVGGGALLTYTLVVTNRDGVIATGVWLTDRLPSGVTLVSASPACNGTDSVRCDIGVIEPAASRWITIAVTTPETGRITNTASVAGEQFDYRQSNNAATESTAIGLLHVYLPLLIK